MLSDQLVSLLEKQKLVDGMVHRLQMPRQQAVESLLQKQHDAQLLNFIDAASSVELAQALNRLGLAHARLLLSKISELRKNEVLSDVSDARRRELGQERLAPEFFGNQVNVFELIDGRLKQIPIACRKDLEGVRPIWVDLVHTSEVERAFIGAHFGVDLPDPLNETELEVSARFYVHENDDIHLHSNFLHDRKGDSRGVPVSFILRGGILFSLRNEELPVFRLQRRRALSQTGYVNDCIDVLLDLYGADVECSADSLENIYASLGQVGRLVLSEAVSDEQAAVTLADIAEEEDQNGRIRGNILDTQRALNFLMRGRLLTSDQIGDAKQILRNIDSLNSHTAFLFDKINFLMDATIGFININQNKRVNQLTVFSVVFMPINILAGMGGMSEFSMMTQGVPWPVAYGVFVLCSVLVGLLTYLGLKRFEKRKMSAVRLPKARP
jgi:magnesium transporter